MVFQASDYTIWIVFILLETLAFRLAGKPEHRPFRAFMGLCLIRDFILLAWSCHLKYYWVSCWVGLEVEWIAMALLAARMIGKGRAWRFPAFTIAAMVFHYAWNNKWPVYAHPEEIFHFERNCCLIVLGTLLVGALFTFEKSQLRLTVAMAVLAGSDMLSAQSYLLGNYSPMVASAVWAIGLGILATALRANPAPRHKPLCAPQAVPVSRADSRSIQPPGSSTEARLLADSERLKEWTSWPCHTPIQ